MHALVVLGLIIELGGLLAAGYGFLRTFRRFAGPGQQLWSPVTTRVRQIAISVMSRIERWIRRILGRPSSQTIGVAGSASGFGTLGNARITTTYGRLRHLWDHEGALVQLHERTNELRRMIEDARFERAEGDRNLREGITELQSRIDDELGLVREERRAEAMSDSRWQFGGFLAVLVGLGLQLVGAILQLMEATPG